MDALKVGIGIVAGNSSKIEADETSHCVPDSNKSSDVNLF